MANFCVVHTSKHQLVAAASTTRACRAMHISTNASQISFLLLHEVPHGGDESYATYSGPPTVLRHASSDATSLLRERLVGHVQQHDQRA